MRIIHTLITAYYLIQSYCLARYRNPKKFLRTMNSFHKSLVICGPSGVGKGTLIAKLLKSYPQKLGLSVSRTSRKPRPGEINGVHYHFITRDEFESDIQNGTIKYIEHAKVHANIYGTRLDAVESVHQEGKVCVLDVDVSGVIQMKGNQFPAKYVFITAPSINVLESRLRGRGTETEEQIRIRLDKAEEEIKFGTTEGNFDAVVINEVVDDTYSVLVRLLREWFPEQNF